MVHGAKHSVELERENFGTSMCHRSVGFSIDAPQKVLLGSCDDVEMRSFDEGETRSDLYRVERFTSEALHSLSSTGFRCCCYHWTRGASARTVSQEVTENEDILKFGSLIVLSNTQEAGSSAALTIVCLYRSRTWSCMRRCRLRGGAVMHLLV